MAGAEPDDRPVGSTDGKIEGEQGASARARGAKQTCSLSEQVLAVVDQTLPDADQTGADRNQANPGSDEFVADCDPAASDHHRTGGRDAEVHSVSRDIRPGTAREREENAAARLQTTRQRHATARARDLAALSDDQAAAARELAIAQSDIAYEQYDGGPVVTGVPVIVHAAGQRKRTARQPADAPSGSARNGPHSSVVTLKTASGASQIHAPGDDACGVRLSWWPLLLIFSVFCALAVLVTNMVASSDDWFNWYLAVVWSIDAPLAVIGLLGALHISRRGGGRIPRSRFSGTTDRKVVFTVPTLGRADTANALRRVLRSITDHAPNNLTAWRIDVVTEQGADGRLLDELCQQPNVRVLVVPSSYETPNGAKFKTRANHYAMEQRRRHGENDARTYVYHLDDDTHIGPDTVASLAEFIVVAHDRHYLAQGTLAFPRELTTSGLAWYCDAIRPASDLTRFAFFTGALARPLGGLHGEHVIIRADIEDEIGWDYHDTVIEDAYFALEFAQRYPGRSTTLKSFSYGASPSSVSELVRQRRRWCEGLLRLVCKRSLPWRVKLPLFYSVVCWATAPFQFMPLMLGLGLAMGVPALPPYRWIIVLWVISVTTLMWQYTQGIKVNMAASRDQRDTWWRSALCVPGLYVFSAIETYASVLGIIRFIGIGRQREAEVLAKPL